LAIYPKMSITCVYFSQYYMRRCWKILHGVQENTHFVRFIFIATFMTLCCKTSVRVQLHNITNV